MNQSNSPYIFVIGNEKGGAGKTTCSMHLIASLLNEGFKVGSIDVDCRQHSLTRYLQNRENYNKQNPEQAVLMPSHRLLQEAKADNIKEKEALEQADFESALAETQRDADIIIIDTPGSHSYFSQLAHSYANTVITPINDSFIDIDVIAKINPDNMEIIAPSIYSQMVWQQKLQRAQRDGGSIDWVIMRNRLSTLDAVNKRNVAAILEKFSKRIACKQAPGFSERVIFRELFLQGLTLLDLNKTNYDRSFNLSHVAARHELRQFLKCLNIDKIKQKAVM